MAIEPDRQEREHQDNLDDEQHPAWLRAWEAAPRPIRGSARDRRGRPYQQSTHTGGPPPFRRLADCPNASVAPQHCCLPQRA